MKKQRFELALEHLQPEQWKRFEELASEFLSSEFPNLRTMASPSGDRGRDAELFSPESDPSVLLQYSVAQDWSNKITKTAKRIEPEFPDVTVVVYVTNQVIGANADDLKKTIRKNHNLYLDIRDRNWFLERLHSSSQREIAAESLAQDIVDPYLASREIVTRKATALTSPESQAAFVYLAMQWEDDTREKGLTKLCFEALVRAVLRGTYSSNRITREELHRRVRSVMPTHPADQVDTYTDAALGRLTKKYIRHWTALDEFCLMHAERIRSRDRLALYESADLAFQNELDVLTERLALRYDVKVDGEGELHNRVRRVLEKFLLSRGEAFAAAVRTGSYHTMGFEELRETVIRDIGENPDSAHIGADLPDLVVAIIKDLVEYPSDATQSYLRSLSDTYTLLAFLRETPDVQSAIVKMFSDGEIWLDTSIILPLFAEDLLDPENRRYANLFRAASEAGLQLSITPGVLEEIERHMNRSLACNRVNKEWKGDAPFLYSLYTLSGRAAIGFNSWIEQFRGDARPEDDIADYLQERFGINVKDIEADIERAPSDLRTSLEEIWHRIHEGRRGFEADAITTHRLAIHDSENYLGVIQRRHAQRDSPFGYNSWWLTLDRNAYDVQFALREHLMGRIPDSPVMSPDFLANYLAFGPIRGKLSQRTEASLPIVIDVSVTEYLPAEFIELAESVREEMKDSPEYLIRRKVRDKLDAAKSRRGIAAKGGATAMQEDLKDQIQKKGSET